MGDGDKVGDGEVWPGGEGKETRPRCKKNWIQVWNNFHNFQLKVLNERQIQRLRLKAVRMGLHAEWVELASSFISPPPICSLEISMKEKFTAAAINSYCFCFRALTGKYPVSQIQDLELVPISQYLLKTSLHISSNVDPASPLCISSPKWECIQTLSGGLTLGHMRIRRVFSRV